MEPAGLGDVLEVVAQHRQTESSGAIAAHTQEIQPFDISIRFDKDDAERIVTELIRSTRAAEYELGNLSEDRYVCAFPIRETPPLDNRHQEVRDRCRSSSSDRASLRVMGVVGQKEIDPPDPESTKVLVGSKAVAAQRDDAEDMRRESVRKQGLEALFDGRVRTAAIVVDAKFVVNCRGPIDAHTDLHVLVAEQVDPFTIDERSVRLD